MTITAPISVETQNADIALLDDDIQIIEPSAVVTDVVRETPDPLLPFLALGVISLLSILLVSVLLAF